MRAKLDFRNAISVRAVLQRGGASRGSEKCFFLMKKCWKFQKWRLQLLRFFSRSLSLRLEGTGLFGWRTSSTKTPVFFQRNYINKKTFFLSFCSQHKKCKHEYRVEGPAGSFQTERRPPPRHRHTHTHTDTGAHAALASFCLHVSYSNTDWSHLSRGGGPFWLRSCSQ